MEEIKNHQPQYSRDKKKNHLTPEEDSDLGIENSEEVLVVCPEDYQEEENKEREADGQKRRRDESNLDFFFEEKLKKEVD
jgi:hypothetical protein